ncbi:hypothetical protein [Caballeronia sp. dw_276]|jgi:hypothetical protein|uniref:hypothetical protein n=1 Tax=Caballeronia sp. dw_276 TaxID=2719795 RepID=UPI001BD62822|nr:hypothetical protein [Caballeronia sp. dw_276]
MTTELTRYNGFRYVMRKGQRFSVGDDADKAKAGRDMLMGADMHIWESNAPLVARVESFLRRGFSWYSQSDKSARDTLQTLLSYVRDGAVDILQESGASTNAFENGGFTLDPPARQERPDAPPFDYNALLDADRESLRQYNAAIDARIEREARLSPSPFETVQESEMPFLLSVVSMVARSANLGRQAVQKAASGLGDAAPFEYVQSVAGGDVLSIAARGVSESHEAECFADYETDLDMCSAGRAMYQSPAYFLECKARAFAKYHQCRGY